MGIAVFIILWVLLAIGILWIAIGQGPRGARESLHGQGRTARRNWAVAFAIFYVAVGIAVPILIINADTEQKAEVAGVGKLTAAQTKGREIFGQKCAQCHTLAAANAVGKQGPNLDQLQPKKPLVLDAVEKGRVRGNGTMPAGLVFGNQAEDVAEFVDEVAGR
jgi:mono/diheme cytochrome c family protein